MTEDSLNEITLAESIRRRPAMYVGSTGFFGRIVVEKSLDWLKAHPDVAEQLPRIQTFVFPRRLVR